MSRARATGSDSHPELTTTSHAILGLLCLRDWSTYELAQQMQRSMRVWWPRAESRVYEEPKRLLRLGLVTARDEPVGDRPRTVYSITPEGRDAFEAWLGEPGRLFRLEFEGMLKVLFADQGPPERLAERVTDIRDAARAEMARGVAFDEEYLETGGPFPERLPLVALVSDLYVRLVVATLDWAETAAGTVARWPSSTAADEARAFVEERAARTRARLDGAGDGDPRR